MHTQTQTHTLTRTHTHAHANLSFTGDVYIFIKTCASSLGAVPHVFLWRGSHSCAFPLLAWNRLSLKTTLTQTPSLCKPSNRKLRVDLEGKYGKFASYQEMAQGCETAEFIALFPSLFVVYEGRLAAMFSLSAGALKHQRARRQAFGSNIYLVPPLASRSSSQPPFCLIYFQNCRCCVSRCLQGQTQINPFSALP